MRNQAVFSVLAGRRLPVGSLVNVRAGDFDPVSGIVSVFKNSAGQRARFVLRGDARTAMARYFSQVLGGSTSSEAPLFAAQVAGSQVLNKSEAVCLPEMRRLIRAEVRRLKLSSDVRVLGKKKR
jgi:hypothetical protein